MVRTRVGYTGGTSRNPTYHHLGDHTETVELDFDPAVTTYERLLAAFWSSHDPSRPVWSRQYMAAVFYHDAEQERLARETAARQPAPVNTALLPAATFYLAEEYHQNYTEYNPGDAYVKNISMPRFENFKRSCKLKFKADKK